MTCCRCNKTGRCRNCSCVKTGSQCLSCLPGRLGQCSNGNVLTPQRPEAKNRPSPIHSTQLPYTPGHSPQSPRQTQTTPQQTGARDDEPNQIPNLPAFIPMTSPTFVWGNLDSGTALTTITSIYKEIVHWRKNNFPVPFGNAGNSFVAELSCLFRAYAEGSALEGIAMKAITVASILLLQKPHLKTKPKDHISSLTR